LYTVRKGEMERDGDRDRQCTQTLWPSKQLNHVTELKTQILNSSDMRELCTGRDGPDRKTDREKDRDEDRGVMKREVLNEREIERERANDRGGERERERTSSGSVTSSSFTVTSTSSRSFS